MDIFKCKYQGCNSNLKPNSNCCPKCEKGGRGATGPIGATGPPGPVDNPAGSNTDIQYNENGLLGGSDNFQFDYTTNTLNLSTTTTSFGAGLVTGGMNITGGGLGLNGNLELIGSTSNNSVSVKAADSTGNYTINLPTAQGAAETLLTNDGSGNLYWMAAHTPGGNNQDVQYNDNESFNGSNNLQWDNSTNTLTVNTTTTSTAGGLVVGGVNVVGGSLGISDNLELIGSTSTNALSLKANDTTAAYSITLPAAQGGVNSTLANDGSGNLTWIPTPSPGLSWLPIIYSNANTGANQLYSYCYQNLNLPGNITADVTWTSDPTAVIDNTYFVFTGDGGKEMTCTTDVPSHLQLRVQVDSFFSINAGSGPNVDLYLLHNGNKAGRACLKWSGIAAGDYNCLNLNETLPNIVTGDIIKINFVNSTAQIPTYHVCFKAWLTP